MSKTIGGWATIGLASLFVFMASCTPVAELQDALPVATPDTASVLDSIAEDYVRLSLEIGTKEPGYIDAYYGPAEWKAEAEANPRGLIDLANAVIALEERLDLVDETLLSPMQQKRRTFLLAQLNAARTRLLMLQGETLSFRDEALGLFGVIPEIKPLSHYDPILERLNKQFPGKGTLASRIGSIPARHTIAPEKLEPVFNAAIAECRNRTLEHIPLPEDEDFTMAFVTDKPWSGYNYYQGDYRSRIEINTDLPIRIGRAVDLGCHEGYPGHHVYNMLLERNLSRQRGWVEYQIYPLYSPQSLIAEGSANYGIELAFPGEERLAYEKSVLYPLAGLDPDSADEMAQLQEALRDLSSARFTIAQRYLDSEISREQAIELTQKYMLFGRNRAEQSISFADTYRSYVINYGLGLDMVRDYVESAGQDPAMRWAAMAKVLSEPTLPVDLVIVR
ncbi:hypothetical protein [Alterisphingorhabdus coralli]|uniref:DUF885 domain-containing protein n=1 Tax=Alterisphingorhabdus coralli TaxID=3071408 RepID=A0AA97F8Q7_9SPHN|nr:hypothetical protein [Parasphingorhabdus sp. SCSIO 66989]WOE75576.1 hypothetical protein RB602_02360 [Parasphingorhabdus sp. SCSIO 66989]